MLLAGTFALVFVSPCGQKTHSHTHALTHTRTGRHTGAGHWVGGASSEDPVDGDPLGLAAQFVHGGLQRLEGLVQVVVDDGQVKVVAVGPLDPPTLVHRLLQVHVLQREGRTKVDGQTDRSAFSTHMGEGLKFYSINIWIIVVMKY